ncbi:conjugative transposon protein TraM [Mucilaginibacter sp.]
MEKQILSGGTPQQSIEFLKKRKFFLIIPLLILPFLTMAFWALGGGKVAKQTTNEPSTKGFDMVLPSAQFKNNKEKDKMDIYQAIGKDTSIAKDGVSKSFIRAMGFDAQTKFRPDSVTTIKSANRSVINSSDLQSAKIEAKLAQLNRQLSQPQAEPNYTAENTNYSNQDIKRLKAMMMAMNNATAKDPQMDQLNNMLTKIQAIQNPELAKAETKKKKESDSAFRAIPAVIDGKQKVMNGGTVRLKLTDSIRLKGVLLPKGQLLFGACQVTNQRLLLNIQNIRVGKDILPADLTVFSLDGLPGIPAPEAELSGAAGDGADNALESMQFLSMDESLGSQAAAGGINAAKGLFSKKVKKIKVKLQDNFAVLLRDNSRKK